jgi:hypothetical protein
MFELDQLILSNDAYPDTLTINTADDRIGIFLETPFLVLPCDKATEGETCKTTWRIELCEDESDDPQAELDCPVYRHCFVVAGDWPDRAELINFRISTATAGVNLMSITWIGGGTIYRPYNPADATTGANELDPQAGYHVGTTATTYGYSLGPVAGCSGTTWIEWRASSLEFTSNTVRVCLTYSVTFANASPGYIVFQFDAWETPCGTLFSETVQGALLVECGLGLNTCIYFPYVLFGYDDFDADGEFWATGIAVTNIGVAADAATQVITYTLKDINGATFTDTKNTYLQIIEVQTVDDMISAGGWAPTGNCGWLKVDANFLVDGFQYNYVITVDGMMFGAAVLPRQIRTIWANSNAGITPVMPIMD